MSVLIHLIDQYGYIVLFFSLMLELIIIPIPNEILMSYVGFLAYQGKLNLYITILVGGLGGIIGVSISYWIGYKLGAPFFNRYGSKIHLGPKKIEQMSRWNDKYGKRLLLFCYFIPGVRHVTSLFSGITKVPFKSFAVFSYLGVYLWVGTFITLGKIFGPKWEQFHQEAKIVAVITCIVLGCGYLIYFFIKVNRQRIKENSILLFENFFNRFHSFLKIKIFIFFIGVAFIGLFSLMIGLIQDFIANEFNQFNMITSTIIFYLFDETWKGFMTKFSLVTSWQCLLIVGCLTFLWIAVKGQNKWLEIQYYLIGIAGAIIFGKGLHFLFSKLPSAYTISNNFPSEQTLISIVILIYFMYVIVRHTKGAIFNTLFIIIEAMALVLIFISKIYLGLQPPSDLIAGYVFGGTWISFIILLIEGSRLINLIKTSLRTEFK